MTNPLVLQDRKETVEKLCRFHEFPIWFSTYNQISRRLGWCPGCMKDNNGDEWCSACYESLFQS